MHQISSRQPRDHIFKTVSEAWPWAVNFIELNGIDVVTEDGVMTREYRNLLLTIDHPGESWPVRGSGWDLPGLDRYGRQLLSGDMMGFDYSYGNRLTCGMPGTKFDQIEIACEMLRDNPNTRRAAMYVWCPPLDLDKPGSHPCMMVVDPLIRGGKLHLAAMFRSHDIGRAYVENLYGLWKLSEHMAGKIGCFAGEITTFSVSAHYYKD